MKKLFLLIAFFSIFLNLTYSQNIKKSIQIPYSQLRAVAVDANDIYAVGGYNSPGSFNLNQGYIVKLNQNLDTLWKRQFGSTLIDQLRDVVFFDGKVYAVGISWRPKTENRKSDAWLLILNPDGSLYKQKLYGGEGQDFANKIVPTPDGNLMLVGAYGNQGDENVWIVKINPEGEILWDRKFGTLTNYEEGVNICPVSDGYIVLSKVIIKGRDNSDAWIFKIDKTGKLLWDRTFIIKENNYFHSCFRNAKGWLLVGNTAKNNKATKADIWLMQISSNGTKMNDKTLGTYMYEWSRKALRDKNSIYIFGTFSSKNRAKIWQIDKNGNLLNQKTYNLPGIYGAAQLNNNFVIVGGDKGNGYVAIVR